MLPWDGPLHEGHVRHAAPHARGSEKENGGAVQAEGLGRQGAGDEGEETQEKGGKGDRGEGFDTLPENPDEDGGDKHAGGKKTSRQPRLPCGAEEVLLHHQGDEASQGHE